MRRREFVSLPLLAGSRALGQKRYPPRITAWLHSNDWAKGVSSVASNYRGAILEVSPMWYELKDDGSVGAIVGSRAEDLTLLKTVENQPLILRPIVTNVTSVAANPNLAITTFLDQNKRSRQISSILAIASNGYFNGIDLDYEGIRGGDLALLADFVEELSFRLHTVNKSLVVDLEVQSDDSVLPSWSRIGQAVDLVRLMVYSEHTERTSSGPITSLAWSKRHLERAFKAIVKEKLSHGIAIYGRLWGERNYSATWESLMQYGNGAPISRDDDNIPSYKKGNEVVWFEDAESIRTKILQSLSLGLDAFSFWRLGGEDPAIWPMIRSLGGDL